MTFRAPLLCLFSGLATAAALSACLPARQVVTSRALPVHGAWFEPADGGFVSRTPGGAVRVDASGASVRLAGKGKSTSDVRFQVRGAFNDKVDRDDRSRLEVVP